MYRSTIFSRKGVCFGLMFVLVLMTAGLGHAQGLRVGPTFYPTVPIFPAIVGIVEGQVARINGLNFYPPDPCVVTLMFIDSQGNILAQSENLTLSPGKSEFFDYQLPAPTVSHSTSSNPVLDSYGRAEIRGLCVALDKQSTACSANVEIFDSVSGRTIMYEPPDPCILLQN